jgi:hypothetical protein
MTTTQAKQTTPNLNLFIQTSLPFVQPVDCSVALSISTAPVKKSSICREKKQGKLEYSSYSTVFSWITGWHLRISTFDRRAPETG